MKGVNIGIDPQALVNAVGLVYKTVEESDGSRPVMVEVGTVGSIMFELYAYNVEGLDPAEIGPDEVIMVEIAEPVINEQLDLCYGEENGTIH